MLHSIASESPALFVVKKYHICFKSLNQCFFRGQNSLSIRDVLSFWVVSCPVDLQHVIDSRHMALGFSRSLSDVRRGTSYCWGVVYGLSTPKIDRLNWRVFVFFLYFLYFLYFFFFYRLDISRGVGAGGGVTVTRASNV